MTTDPSNKISCRSTKQNQSQQSHCSTITRQCFPVPLPCRPSPAPLRQPLYIPAAPPHRHSSSAFYPPLPPSLSLTRPAQTPPRLFLSPPFAAAVDTLPPRLPTPTPNCFWHPRPPPSQNVLRDFTSHITHPHYLLVCQLLEKKPFSPRPFCSHFFPFFFLLCHPIRSIPHPHARPHSPFFFSLFFFSSFLHPSASPPFPRSATPFFFLSLHRFLRVLSALRRPRVEGVSSFSPFSFPPPSSFHCRRGASPGL